MDWKEWMQNWDLLEFINNSVRRELAKEKFEELDKKIKNAQNCGYDIIHLRKLGYLLHNEASIPILYHASKEAYRCGDGSIAEANVWVILAKKLDIVDAHDNEIYESHDGKRFCIIYYAGSPSSLGSISLDIPKL